MRDILRAEIAAVHLGFRATYPTLMRYRYLKPPPLNLPKWTHREVKMRFRQWQKETGNLPASSQTRRRKRERKRDGTSSRKGVGNNCITLPATMVKSSHSDELKNNGSNNIEATQAINPLLVNDPSA